MSWLILRRREFDDFADESMLCADDVRHRMAVPMVDPLHAYTSR